MSKAAIKYGLIGGGIMVAIFTLSYIIRGADDYKTGEIVGYSNMFLSMIVVFFGIRTYRNKYLGGRMGYWKGVGAGVYISAVAGIILAIYSFIIYAYIMPDFTEKYYKYQVESLQKSDMPPAEKEAEVNKIKSMPEWQKSPTFGGILSFVAIFGIGLLISLISAAILRKSPPDKSQPITAT